MLSLSTLHVRLTHLGVAASRPWSRARAVPLSHTTTSTQTTHHPAHGTATTSQPTHTPPHRNTDMHESVAGKAAAHVTAADKAQEDGKLTGMVETWVLGRSCLSK